MRAASAAAADALASPVRRRRPAPCT